MTGRSEGGPRVRGLAAIVWATVVACGTGPGPGAAATESYVDVPITLDDVRARADPPKVEVSVEQGEQQARRMGGGGCHDPACLVIMVPIFAVYSGAETLAPQHYQVATIREDGQETYSALFGHDGTFLRATARTGDEMRFVGPVELPALGRRIVVEIGRAPIRPDGTLGDMKARPIQEQVDLRGKYEELLGQTQDPTRRGDAVVESVKVLGADASPLARARLADPNESAELKARIVSAVCSSPVLADQAQTKGELIDALAEGGAPLAAAREGLSCFVSGAEPAALPLVRTLAAATCAPAAPGSPEETAQIEGVFALFQWVRAEQPSGGVGRLSPRGADQAHDRLRDALAPDLAACPAGPARDTLAFMLRERVEPERLAAIFSDPRRAPLLFDVDLRAADEHAALLAALERAPIPTVDLARALAHLQSAPDAAELARLSAVYLAVRAPSPADGPDDKTAPLDFQHETRAHLLARMGARPDGVAVPEAVLSPLREAAERGGETQAELWAALAVLGDDAASRRAICALPGQSCDAGSSVCPVVAGRPPTAPGLVDSTASRAVAFGLWLAGWTAWGESAQPAKNHACTGPRRPWTPSADAFAYK